MERLLEFIPLALFLTAMRTIPTSYEHYWLLTYGMSALAAAACIGFKLVTRSFQNKILLGINGYVISGALAIVSGQFWLMELYSTLQSAAMLLWIMGAGIYGLLFSAWFPAVFSDTKQTSLYGAIMALLTAGSFGLAFMYPDSRLLSETIPFSTLFIAHYVLTARLQEKLATQ
ncbi:hypothetical protein [Halodesulfovibrio spirochaetisodalis]|uniref:Permease n=1 Tax=Halodesulfovibrio spirochaetisodalis TaxID=1560234 RepID=A0A1B7X9D3_9BACT|nr:hypothetical protein [Halodesulfovibrio spirochaetisodalis]OBQ45993.1 hypothetical protein SP90_14955 [Halodesulfovibrio spirochaetisodalis]